MEEGKNILKELKIDWDQTVTENFSPLQMALKLSSNCNLNREFNNILHRLEETMEKLISSDFQGFNEAFESFERYKNTNINILNNYSEAVERLKNLEIFNANPTLYNSNNEEQEVESKYKICAMIVEARDLYRSFLNSTDPYMKSQKIIKVLQILSDSRVSQIKGVFEYYKTALKSYQLFSNEINKKLLDFIIRNEVENSHLFTVIIDLESILSFNDYCLKNFQKELFNLIEDLILNINEETSLKNEYDNFNILNNICQRIGNSVECIIDNMSFSINKLSKKTIKPEEDDFFGKKKADSNFIFDLSGCMVAIKQVLRVFIERYSLEPEKSDGFDIDFILDSFDFSKVYSENSSVIKRLMKGSKRSSHCKNNFTLITPIDQKVISFLLSHIKNQEIRNFIFQIVESKFYSEIIVEDKISKIHHIIKEISNLDNLSNFETDLEMNIFNILDSCITIEEERNIKIYLKRTLFITLLHSFNDIFVSNFVIRADFKNFLETINQRYEENVPDLFKAKNYNASTFLITIDQFKDALITKNIEKSDLILTPKKYCKIFSILNFLKSINDRLESKEMSFLSDLYEKSLNRQLILDFFYYFDLLYRQGSYFYYLKLCCKILEINENGKDNKDFIKDFEDCLQYYCENNVPSISVKNYKDLDQFIDALKILGEIIGENIEIFDCIEFFKDVRASSSKNSKGKILLQKIS